MPSQSNEAQFRDGDVDYSNLLSGNSLAYLQSVSVDVSQEMELCSGVGLPVRAYPVEGGLLALDIKRRNGLFVHGQRAPIHSVLITIISSKYPIWQFLV